MHNLLTEESPQFNIMDKEVRSYRHRVNYDLMALDIRTMINKSNRGEKALLTVEYPHSQISNVIGALRRRDLEHNSDYRITRCLDHDKIGKDGEPVETLIISAV